ncbi:MAG: hypothetical protein ACXVEF_39705 [Polyangiales bacterium]
MTLRSISAPLVLAGLLGLACSHEKAAPPPASAMKAPSTSAVSGTDVYVTLDTPIASYGATTGQSVVATVIQPVKAMDGSLLIDAGAKLRGHVVSVEMAPKARVNIKFDSVETTRGSRPIQATILDAGGYATPGAPTTERSYDTSLFAPIGPLAATGGGPPTNEGAEPAPVYQLFVPTGSKLHLMLTSDLPGC